MRRAFDAKLCHKYRDDHAHILDPRGGHLIYV